MRRLKAKQRHGCDYCRNHGVKRPAVWTEQSKFACEDHKGHIEAERDDGYRTQADYDTWMKL